MAHRCTNLQTNADGEYEDPISLDVIPANRLVHLPRAGLTFCYDALELLRHLRNQTSQRRPPTLPDNQILLLPAGIEEVRRVARLSFPQRYQVVGERGPLPSFDSRQATNDYVQSRPNLGLSVYSYNDPGDDPILEDLLYPEGFQSTSMEPLAGPYFNEDAMARRAVDNRREEVQRRVRREQEAQADPPSPEPERMPRPEWLAPGDRELTYSVARQVRPGEWRCGQKPRNGRPVAHPTAYCSSREISELRAQGLDAYDPADWGLGRTLYVDGEEVMLAPLTGTPGCSSVGSGVLINACRPDLLEELAAREDRFYLRDDDHEIAYSFDRDSQSFRCEDLDDPRGQEYDCTEQLREEFEWNSVAEDPEVIYRRLELRGPIECATKEQWHRSRATGRPIPWRECREEQRQYLRSLPGFAGDFFSNLESGQYAGQVEEDNE
jgi:hypothetical protein